MTILLVNYAVIITICFFILRWMFIDYIRLMDMDMEIEKKDRVIQELEQDAIKFFEER
ncbi:hypothetical protein L313_2799 [Acinetobacter haemolyticus CIP 64.3 = MTCC 9819]|uniref:Uncharacterized protein n=1 Tax=Acinetobacter haemolyticus CIP 64.3 = MTCC 9819 TaxID=1217659 RepID=N9GEM5_ACIHA|nr:hypothetical protein F927_03356 [Acinetobacter haemolyticus CIP 64.3 = MTCC 9819]EPR90389.1 hypothetical protein L313_2799 [Acinetobacter haemolyticus CIP 64.3 = MTCC 9819]SPT48661.1 Uncharacterised protein [Acinetobacter haemolyticus]SUU61817.1 Uncharacterised protein [Acinetobacter haemolyticus]